MSTSPHGPLRVGVGGPVGSGKTALMERLAKAMRDRYDLAAITNDIYTKEDAEILTRAGALPPERIMGVETGGSRVLAGLAPTIAALADIIPDLTLDDLGSATFRADLGSFLHESQYTRLFRS